MAKWFVAAKKADFNKIAETFGISPVTARILRNRGLTKDEEFRKFLNGTKEDMYPPELLLDMEAAAELLAAKLREKKKIRVIGDYDADGVCSACILHQGLKAAGADADTAIPDRMKDGYGLNEHLVLDAYEAGVDTILTCDNPAMNIVGMDNIEIESICITFCFYNRINTIWIDNLLRLCRYSFLNYCNLRLNNSLFRFCRCSKICKEILDKKIKFCRYYIP